jgi:probable rRNA maturation factor
MLTMKPKHQIDIQVEKGAVNTKPLRQAVLATLAQQGIVDACEVVIVMSDDKALQELNRRFRGIDRPTDVLSFSDDTRGPFANIASGQPYYLGDVVISVERAEAQAQTAEATVLQELQLLVVHGMLHLLGYDHETPQDKAQMWAAQDAVLERLNVSISLPE